MTCAVILSLGNNRYDTDQHTRRPSPSSAAPPETLPDADRSQSYQVLPLIVRHILAKPAPYPSCYGHALRPRLDHLQEGDGILPHVRRPSSAKEAHSARQVRRSAGKIAAASRAVLHAPNTGGSVTSVAFAVPWDLLWMERQEGGGIPASCTGNRKVGCVVVVVEKEDGTAYEFPAWQPGGRHLEGTRP